MGLGCPRSRSTTIWAQTCNTSLSWNEAIAREIAVSTHALEKGMHLASQYPYTERFTAQDEQELIGQRSAGFSQLAGVSTHGRPLNPMMFVSGQPSVGNPNHGVVGQSIYYLDLDKDKVDFFKFGGEIWRSGLYPEEFTKRMNKVSNQLLMGCPYCRHMLRGSTPCKW